MSIASGIHFPAFPVTNDAVHVFGAEGNVRLGMTNEPATLVPELKGTSGIYLYSGVKDGEE